MAGDQSSITDDDRGIGSSASGVGLRSRGQGKRSNATTGRALDRTMLGKNDQSWRRRSVPTPPMAPLPALSANQIEIVRQRQEFLERMSEHLRRVGRATMRDSTLRRELAAHESKFRRIMQSHPNGLTEPAARRRAIAILDAAYERGRSRWAADPVWRSLYADPSARATLEDARRRGFIELTNEMIQRDSAPRAIAFVPRGRSVVTAYESLNIDHAVPLDRNPFRAFDPENWRVTTARYNQHTLNEWARRSPFPMEVRRAADDIEEFVQANGLSRRQRRLELRARAARAAGVLAPILELAGARERADVYAGIASDIRASQHRSRPSPHIARGSVDAGNLGQRLDWVFKDRTPPDTDSSRRRELVDAFEDWVDDSVTSGEFHTILQRVDRVAVARDRNEQLGAMMVDVLFIIDKLNDAHGRVDAWLGASERYLRRAQLLENVRGLREEVLESELQSWGIDLDDAVTIADHQTGLAASYRGYVRDLERLRDLIERAVAIHDAERRLIDESLNVR